MSIGMTPFQALYGYDVLEFGNFEQSFSKEKYKKPLQKALEEKSDKSALEG